MPFLRRTVLICNLVLIALLTSFFGVASANSFTYVNHSDSTESMLKMEAPALDCQQRDENEIILKNQIALEKVMKSAGNESKAVHHCCASINVMTLFPATFHFAVNLNQESSLAPVYQEQAEKTNAIIELIYRPPIV